MDFVSVTAFAKLHGVSKAAAQKWQGRGLLTFRDGKVDVVASDRALCHAGLGRFADAATRDRQPATRTGNQPVAEVAGLADELTAAAEDADLAPALIAFAAKLAEGHHVDLITAQTYKENGLALLRLIDARTIAHIHRRALRLRYQGRHPSGWRASVALGMIGGCESPAPVSQSSRELPWRNDHDQEIGYRRHLCSVDVGRRSSRERQPPRM